MLELRRCPLCETSLGKVLLTIAAPDRFELSVGITSAKYRREWRHCGGCGAAVNEIPRENRERLRTIAQNYYEVDLGSHVRKKFDQVMNLPDGQSDNAGRAQRVLDKVLAINARQGLPRPTSLRAMDVGAGTGVFLARLNQLCLENGIELDAVAIEPDPIAAGHLRSLGLMRVHETVLDDSFAEGEFDLVTFNKVIEHIEYPIGVVAVGRRILTDTGLIYVEVPDIQTVHCRPSTDNILGALHHHLYAPATLDHVLHRAGLISIDIRRILEPSGKLTVFGFSVTEQHFQRLASANYT